MQSCGVLFDVKQKDHRDKSACQARTAGQQPSGHTCVYPRPRRMVHVWSHACWHIRVCLPI